MQGVSYRRFVQQSAQDLKLNGWTRNLSDGRVESCVMASPERLEELVRMLKLGPPLSRVDRVEIFPMKIKATMKTTDGFEIRPDARAPESRD